MIRRQRKFRTNDDPTHSTTTWTYAIKACRTEEKLFPTAKVCVFRGWRLQAGNSEARRVETYHQHNDSTYIISFVHSIAKIIPLHAPNHNQLTINEQVSTNTMLALNADPANVLESIAVFSWRWPEAVYALLPCYVTWPYHAERSLLHFD